MRNATAASAALFERALKVMPGGSTRAFIYTPPFPPYAVKGAGARITDADGRTFLDFTNNLLSTPMTDADIDQFVATLRACLADLKPTGTLLASKMR